MQRGDGLDGRRHDGAYAGLLLGFGGKADVVRDGYDIVAGAEGKDIVRDAGDQADDAMRMVRHGDAATGLIRNDTAGNTWQRDEREEKQEGRERFHAVTIVLVRAVMAASTKFAAMLPLVRKWMWM